MPTIFITSFHPLVSRNLFSTGLLDMIKQSFRIVLLVPAMKREYFIERFAGENIIVEGVDHRLSRRDILSRKIFLAIADTNTLRIKKRSEFFLHKNPIRYFFSIFPGIVIGHFKIGISIVRLFDTYLKDTSRVRELFDRYQPVRVFSSDVQNEIDVLCLYEARARGIGTVGMVRSWDNLSAKGVLRVIPDVLAVNNEIVKKEAMQWSFVPQDKIAIVGIPHYDRYVTPRAAERRDFLAGFGLDPSRKTIFFAPIGERYLPGKSVDDEILRALASLEVNIIVRMPPTDTARLDPIHNARARIAYDDAGVRSWKRGGSEASRKASEIGEDDGNRLIAELSASDVVVTGLSTILIDGAIFDKPLISVCFDKPEWDVWERFQRYHGYDHVRPVLESGGVRIVYSSDELVRTIEMYMKDPRRDADGRERIRREETFALDGQSTKRLSEVIMSPSHQSFSNSGTRDQ